MNPRFLKAYLAKFISNFSDEKLNWKNYICDK